MQRNHKPQILKQFLAASAALLVAGGAFAQASAPAAPGASPAPAGKPGMGEHRHHGGGMWMKAIDTDGDGAISKAEADAWFNKLDTNRDGKIDKAEMDAHRKTAMAEHHARMQAAFDEKFKAADKNGDGALTKAEANAGMPGLAKRFDQLDANRDGKLTRDEIRAGMEKMHRDRPHRGDHGPRGQAPGSQPAPLNPAAPSTSGG
ncbi:EF-hand domain-containing protein [Cupriavidus necator]|uniref:EF-hand domain-containing protein n=1 Tax=Cupriavidus necator TaxID=106590 RepID=UPI00277E7DF5|nr:EF-hand domain-containing protein [Cupriavidus necator]MDQ0142722.1 Ca2+-binding EF-hand superfamily protein [Cupriavidus necator]